MNGSLILCLALLLGATGSLAADPRSLAGVYKYQFDNGTIDGDEYRSENILELVPHGHRALYFRTELDFYNGHRCSLYGIAHPVKEGFEFREDSCRFILKPRNGNITFEDVEGECRNEYCGARGGFSGVEFTAAQKRPIRYMKRLLRSREYRAAIKHDKHGASTLETSYELWEAEKSKR